VNNLKALKLGQTVVVGRSFFSPKEFPIKKDNLRLDSIGRGSTGQSGIVWVTDNNNEFKEYYYIEMDTLKLHEGKNLKELQPKEKAEAKKLIDEGMKLLKARPLVKDLAKELNGKEIGKGKITDTIVDEEEGTLQVVVEVPEYNFKETYWISDRRGYYELTFKHNTYNIGKDTKSAEKEFIAKVSEYLNGMHEQVASDPKTKKQISKQAKELHDALRDITSRAIGLGNDYRKVMRDWSGKDGSNWRNNRSAYPALRKYINKLETLGPDDYSEILKIEDELSKIAGL
jgi:hypothetical protein